MSQQIQEQLSALMDGELTREETLFLLRRAGHDPGIAADWSRFHLVRQSLRRQEILPLRADFAEVVRTLVESEALPTRTRAGAGTPWLRWASGGAVAASVAVAALMLTTPTTPRAPADRAVATVPAAQPLTTGTPSDFRPPMLAQPLPAQPVSAATAGFNAPGTPMDPRLQSYLIRHYDAAGAAGQSALMPYVLLVVPSQPQATAPVTPDARAESRQ